MNLANEADELALALRLGLATVEEAISWTDEAIIALDQPPYALIEASCAGKAPIDEQRQLIERDICLLYHQLSEYSGIMGDLAYGSVFALPYWEHLSLPIAEPGAGSFARDGCLVMILAMACESIDGSGAYILPRLDACLAAIARIDAADADTARLVATVRLALQLVQSEAAETEPFHAECDWVYRRYVHGYFTERASSRSRSEPA